jgi:AraC-like DNA-binding protein
MRPDATVAVQEARLIAGAAALKGVTPDWLFRQARVNTADLCETNARLSRAAFDRLVEEAVHLSGDLDLGLHAAEHTEDGRRLPDPLRYALRSCATVGDQYRLLARYARLLHADANVTFSSAGAVARLTHELPTGRAVTRRQMGERLLASLVLLTRRHAGAGFAPREVWLAHPAPRDLSTHERIFQAPLRFEQPCDAIIVSRDVLDVRPRQGDAGLQRVLEAHLATLVPEAEPIDLADLVRRRLRGTSGGVRLPDVATVAGAAAMSPRTLQRRLADEGTTYHDLVTEVREDLARQHLRESRLSISEVAYVLGFSGASAFHRAFKRWTDETPRAYRLRARHGAPGERSGAQGQDPPPPRA